MAATEKPVKPGITGQKATSAASGGHCESLCDNCPQPEAQGAPELFKPLRNVVLRVKVVDNQADPAGSQDDDGANHLADQGNGFFENVDDSKDGQDEADQVDNGSHCSYV
jgi:hypothetical protein